MDPNSSNAVPVEDGPVEEVLDVVDIEEYGKRNERPPRARHYRIRINKTVYVVDVPHMTGRQILELAGKTPVERYRLQQKLHGGQVKVIGLDEVVDFLAPGVERFQSIPLNETEGGANATAVPVA